MIVVDHYVLPYEDILDWSEFSIRVPEHLLLQVPQILRAIPPKTVAAMQRRVAQVYEQVGPQVVWCCDIGMLTSIMRSFFGHLQHKCRQR